MSDEAPVTNNSPFLSFFFLAANFGLLVISINMAVGAHYHPNAASSPYAGWMFYSAILFSAVAFVLTIAFLVLRKKPVRRHFPRILATVFGAEVLCAAAILFLVEPVPDSFTQYAGNDAYRVPSVYTQRQGGKPGPKSEVNLSYCYDDWSGYYERQGKLGYCRTVDTTLSREDITSYFDAYFQLDHEWSIPRDGDRITDLAALAEKMDKSDADIGPGLAAYASSPAKPASAARAFYLVLDDRGQITLLAKCGVGGQSCRILSKSDAGLLAFSYDDGQKFDYTAWKERERKIFDMIASWQREPIQSAAR